MSKKEIIIVLILIAIACVRFFFFIPEKPNLGAVLGKEVVLEGIVNDDPDIRLKTKHLNIKLKDSDTTILVYVDRTMEVRYGDLVYLSGILEEPENFTTDSGKEFNYKRYLSNQDIYYIIKNADLKIITTGNGNQIKSFLFKIKNSFIDNINRVIPSPESDLGGGLILGIKGGFDNEMKNEFVETGTIHIVALSGYNISIVADGVMKFFGLIFSQIISIVLGIIVIILFILMTGASATSIRAGIMAIIMLLGRMTGRKYMAGRALIIAALFMLAYDPRTIIDMSFQLSFIATAGVLFVTPKIIKWFKWIPLHFGIREMFATTVAATISVLPILLYLTGIFSLVSIPTNILILLFIPLAMLFVFLTGISSFIFNPISIIFGYISYIILLYIISVIHIFGSLSFASFNIQNFPMVLVIIIYILLGWWVFKK